MFYLQKSIEQANPAVVEKSVKLAIVEETGNMELTMLNVPYADLAANPEAH